MEGDWIVPVAVLGATLRQVCIQAQIACWTMQVGDDLRPGSLTLTFPLYSRIRTTAPPGSFAISRSSVSPNATLNPPDHSFM
jgi:hypothetical protein